MDADPRRPGQGQGPPQAVPQGHKVPLTRPARGVGSAGWPRQRPVRVRGQGPGRGVGTVGEAVPCPRSSGPTGLIGTCQVAFEKARAVPEPFRAAAENPAGSPGSRFARSGGDGLGWEDGGMPDPIPLVDLASLAAGGGHPGARWWLDGQDLQANLVRLDRGDRIQPHRYDELEVLVVVVAGRGELTLDGQVHQLAPMVVAHLPKGTVRAIAAVDGPLAYLSVHRRRSAGLQVGGHVQ